jgi:hypothetical protein
MPLYSVFLDIVPVSWGGVKSSTGTTGRTLHILLLANGLYHFTTVQKGVLNNHTVVNLKFLHEFKYIVTKSYCT